MKMTRACLLSLAVLHMAAPLVAQTRVNGTEDLRVRISFMETVLAGETNTEARVRWESRLNNLRDELANMERRAELEAKEKDLSRQRNQNTARALLETIGSIDSDTRGPRERALKLRTAFQRLRAERAEIESERGRLQQDRDRNLDAILALNEALRNKDEDIVLCNLQRDLADLQGRLAEEAVRIDHAIRHLPINPRPTVRTLIEKRRYIRAESKNCRDMATLIADTRQLQDEAAAGLALSESKFAQLDEEIRQLQAQRKFKLGQEIRQLLGMAQGETKVMEDRVRIQRDQVRAIQDTIRAARQLADLYERELAVLNRDFSAVWRHWWATVLVPLAIIASFIVLHIAVSLLALPRFYRQDRLFIARRLSRYVTVALAAVVLAVFFMEDLKAIATALGIAGAALVIALQDLFSSLAGWFVIVTSGKVRVGDRVEIDAHKGDVIDIQLLRTTLLELDNWLGVDEPTGRIIVVPNSYIFKSKVFNYSHVHPYIWSRVDITVTFETPATLAQDVLRQVLETATRDEFQEAQAAARQMERRYGTADTDYHPKLNTLIDDSGVRFSLLYVSHYRRRVAVRNRLNEAIIEAFEQNPRLEFAYPTERRIPTPRPDPEVGPPSGRNSAKATS